MDELERIEQQILDLKEKLNYLEQRRQSLLSQSSSLVASTSKEYSPDQKIALFKSYFKGNEQCYAHHWQTTKGEVVMQLLAIMSGSKGSVTSQTFVRSQFESFYSEDHQSKPKN